MKLVVGGMLMLGVTMLLVGCGVTPLSSTQVSLQEKQYDAQEACFERLEAKDTKLQEMMARVPENQVSLMIVLQEMQENNKALMSMATGNNYNPCDVGPSAFDVQIAEVTEKNKTVRAGVKEGSSLGKFGIGGYTLDSIFGKAGGVVINGDGNEFNKNSKNTSIDAGLDASGEVNQTSSPSNTEKVDSDNGNETVASEGSEEEVVEETGATEEVVVESTE